MKRVEWATARPLAESLIPHTRATLKHDDEEVRLQAEPGLIPHERVMLKLRHQPDPHRSGLR